MKKISVATGSYTAQDGTQKTEWTKIGVIGISQAGKEYALIDPKVNLAALPVGDNGMVMCTIYDESQNQNNQQQNGNGGNYQQPQQQNNGNQAPYQHPQQPQQQQNYNQQGQHQGK